MLLNCGTRKDSESPLDCKEIKPVNPKGNQSCIFIGRSYAEIETPILWPPDVKSWLIGKGPDAREDWRQKEKGMTEDEIVGWHHLHDVWVTSRSWWWTGKPGVLQSMGWQRVEHDWVTELNWKETQEEVSFFLYTEPFWLRASLGNPLGQIQPAICFWLKLNCIVLIDIINTC